MMSGCTDENREQYIARMKAEGYVIRYPEPYELFIDIDTEEQFDAFERSIHILNREVKGIQFEVTVSRNGLPGRHVVVAFPTVHKFSDAERIAWQGALGSDPTRELLSMLRVHDGIRHPVLFAELPVPEPYPFELDYSQFEEEKEMTLPAVHIVLPRATAEWLKGLVQNEIYEDETAEEAEHRKVVFHAIAPLYAAPKPAEPKKFTEPMEWNPDDLPPW